MIVYFKLFVEKTDREGLHWRVQPVDASLTQPIGDPFRSQHVSITVVMETAQDVHKNSWWLTGHGEIKQHGSFLYIDPPETKASE